MIESIFSYLMSWSIESYLIFIFIMYACMYLVYQASKTEKTRVLPPRSWNGRFYRQDFVSYDQMYEK